MNNTYKTFDTILGDAGLLRDRKGQKRTFYSCRHSHITYQLLLGISPSDLTNSLRTSEAQISKHYNRIAAQMKESLIAAGKDDPKGGTTQAISNSVPRGHHFLHRKLILLKKHTPKKGCRIIDEMYFLRYLFPKVMTQVSILQFQDVSKLSETVV